MNSQSAIPSRRDLLCVVPPAVVRGLQANSKIPVGLIGSGGRGSSDASIVQADPRARVTALRDLFDDQVERAIQRIEAGKPAGADAAGCRRVIAAGRRAAPKRCLIFGFQQRYGPVYMDAYRALRNGEIGEITTTRAFWLGGGLGQIGGGGGECGAPAAGILRTGQPNRCWRTLANRKR